MIEDTERDIRAVCNEIAELLIEKNRSYGDSALNPICCFSKTASPMEKLGVRIDDKLSRILRGNESFNEDTELDLLGYLTLRRVARKRVQVNHAVHVPIPPEGSSAAAALEEEETDPLPPRFVKPTATTAVQMLARERAERAERAAEERGRPPGPVNPPKPPYPREVA